MAKCKECGGPLESDNEPCPACGVNPGPETITDLPGVNVKGARAKLRGDIQFEREREDKIAAAECKSCGEPLLGEDDTCPNCGLSGGSETITDLPPLHLREAHKQLKKEIKEAREQRKRKE